MAIFIVKEVDILNKSNERPKYKQKYFQNLELLPNLGV